MVCSFSENDDPLIARFAEPTLFFLSHSFLLLFLFERLTAEFSGRDTGSAEAKCSADEKHSSEKVVQDPDQKNW
jgi:hypothetical protein